MSDNFRFDITGAGLAESLAIAFTQHHTACGWAENVRNATPERDKPILVPRLILFWTDPKGFDGYHPFITAGSAPEVAPMVRAWLAQADYGREPDHDGDNSKGWRLYNEAWTHAGGRWEGFVCIEPAWLMHGK